MKNVKENCGNIVPGNSRRMGIVLVLTGAVCWGFIGIFVQAIGPAVDPFTLSIIRLGTASVLMMPVIALQSGIKALLISRRTLAFFALFGLGYWTIYQMLYFSAIQMTSASVAVIMLYTAPFFIIILARVFLGEQITGRKLAAVTLGVAGVWLMFRSWVINPSPGMMAGGLMALGAGFCFATYFIYVKKALLKTDPFVTAFYAMFFGFIFLIPASLLLFRDKMHIQLDLRTALLILGLAAVSTTLGGTLNIMGLKRIEAGEAGVFSLVEPITTIIVSWFLFRNALQGWQIIGGILVLLGGYLVYRQPEGSRSRQPE